ncbi:hypothetical protein WAI47_02470 [Acinetobacter baumannii]|nr:hypothetical protein [Acinetobacter baumannii]HBI2447167.1 hypothetical protein [Acinetobacter baumannii]
MIDLNKERELYIAAKARIEKEEFFCRDWDLWKACAELRQAEINTLRAELGKAKAQAVPDTHIHSVTLTCAELKEAFDFGAPDGEKDQFQMETEMSIKWLDDGYDGAGYYCWYADLPEEGCIKLGESESGAEG